MKFMVALAGTLAILAAPPDHAQAQAFSGDASIMRNAISSTKVIGDTGSPLIAVGDLIVVEVDTPAAAESIYVSTHVEVFDVANRGWNKVLARANEFQTKYRSGRYGDLRDYYFVSQSSNQRKRKVAFFLPYAAFDLPAGFYKLRYALRLWDSENREVDSRAVKTESEDLEFTRSSVRYVRFETKSKTEHYRGDDGEMYQREVNYTVGVPYEPSMVETLRLIE